MHMLDVLVDLAYSVEVVQHWGVEQDYEAGHLYG